MPEEIATIRLPETAALTDLRLHEVARIAQVRAEHDDAVRLKSLGLCTGRRIELIKGGDPLIVQIQNSRVGLAAQLAACVEVVRTPAEQL